ncbi:MAG: DUF4404 domain-containing protein [Proteobacteria bacterium]|nr:MAG: DUF4404 domain-containing protein [Pseudomonadota bacterium]
MPEQSLRQMLENLRAELNRAGDLDDSSRELLRVVENDIQQVLEREDEPHPESFGDRLRETVDRFESSHPTLTEAVGRVLDQLAKMGI